jgi:hypothetical protein
MYSASIQHKNPEALHPYVTTLRQQQAGCLLRLPDVLTLENSKYIQPMLRIWVSGLISEEEEDVFPPFSFNLSVS